MKLTPLQLKIQQRADKTEKFGCIIEMNGMLIMLDSKYNLCKYRDTGEWYIDEDGQGMWHETRCKEYKVIGNPMNRGRLYYLGDEIICKPGKGKLIDLWLEISIFIDKKDRTLYQKNILERPIKLQKMVLKFLSELEKYD